MRLWLSTVTLTESGGVAVAAVKMMVLDHADDGDVDVGAKTH